MTMMMGLAMMMEQADVAGGRLGFAGHDGDVLEAGGGEDDLADEGERGGVGFGQVELEGREVDGDVVGIGPEGREDEQGEGERSWRRRRRCGSTCRERGRGWRRAQAAASRIASDGEDDEVVVRDPGGGGADHEGELAGELEEQDGDDEEAVGPDVPGGEEADGVAEGAASPDVEAAFEGHLAVEEVDGDGHGRVEDGEGEEPDEGLRVAETGGEAYPGAADDGEHLREDEVAEGELAREMVVAGGCR